MRRRRFEPELWQFVLDASALINIQQHEGVGALEQRKGSILLTERIAYEVALDPRIKKNDPLRKFVLNNPELVTQFNNNEEEECLRLLRQREINPGEATAIAVALIRKLSLVIDERNTKATGKARNHGIKTLGWQEFLSGD